MNGRCTGYLQIGRTAVSVIKGDIINQQVDVIVNTTNAELSLDKAGPSSKAIIAAAGDCVQEECNENYDQNIQLGDVAVTGPGYLDCYNIFHVYMPQCKTQEDIENINRTVNACLVEAENLGHQSIAFPALGTGNLKYAPVDVANSLFDTVEAYNNDNPSTNIELVICVAFKDQIYQTFVSEARARATTKRNEGKRLVTKKLKTSKIQNTNLTVLIGNLTQERTDVIVHTCRHNLQLSSSTKLSSAILTSAGNQIQDELDRSYPDPSRIQYGGMAVTRSYGLPCKRVYHGKVSDFTANYTNDDPSKVLKTFTRTCLETASKFGTKSLSFPALGTGELRFPPDIAASIVIKEIFKYLHNNTSTSLVDIRIVIFGGNISWSSIAKAFTSEIDRRQGARPRNLQSNVAGKPRLKDRYKRKCMEKLKPPGNWSQFTSQKTIKEWIIDKGQNSYQLVDVDRTTFDSVKDLFYKTMRAQGVRVKSIKRIENLSLFEGYGQNRQRFFGRAIASQFVPMHRTPGSSGPVVTTQYLSKQLSGLLEPDLNEVYLFHGTKKERVDILVKSGLDLRLASLNFATLWLGKGIYAAEEANLSAQYTDQQGDKYMFILRVCLGNVYTTPNHMIKLVRPPCRKLCQGICYHQEHFDSVVGEFGKREFVIYDRLQCYPEYLIRFSA